MRNNISLIVLMCIIFLTLSSCNSANANLQETLSESISETETTAKEPFRLGRYEFYVDENGKNAVSIYSNDHKSILTTETFDPVTPTPVDFESLEKGMGLLEVVSRVGLPVGTATFGVITLVFNASDGSQFVIYWIDDMIVDSVLKM